MHQLGDVTQNALQSSSHGEVESPWLSEGVPGTVPQHCESAYTPVLFSSHIPSWKEE